MTSFVFEQILRAERHGTTVGWRGACVRAVVKTQIACIIINDPQSSLLFRIDTSGHQHDVPYLRPHALGGGRRRRSSRAGSGSHTPRAPTRRPTGHAARASLPPPPPGPTSCAPCASALGARCACCPCRVRRPRGAPACARPGASPRRGSRAGSHTASLRPACRPPRAPSRNPVVKLSRARQNKGSDKTRS